MQRTISFKENSQSVLTCFFSTPWRTLDNSVQDDSIERATDMLTVSFSVAVVCLGVITAVCLPRLGRHLGDRRQLKRAHEAELLRQREVIADYEATIDAYRQFVQSDPELSLTAR